MHWSLAAQGGGGSSLAPPFDFTKQMPILRIDALKDARRIPIHDDRKFDPGVGTTLYDLAADPLQQKPFRDTAIERRMLRGIAEVLAAHDAPPEFYDRYGVRRLADAA